MEFPGALYHLTARGNAREAIYRNDRASLALRVEIGRKALASMGFRHSEPD